MIKELALKDIRIDGKTQHRDIKDSVVTHYKTRMAEGDIFPPVELIFDGKNHWLVDGFQRYHAHKKAAKATITANVEEGTKRDAQIKSFSANAIHGLPRPPGAAKHILLHSIFPDPEWACEADETLARWVGGITKQYVGQCRKQYAKPKPETGQESTDTERTLHTSTTESTTASEPEKGDSQNKASTPVLDSKKKLVPSHLQEVFLREDEVTKHIRYLNQMVRDIKAAQVHDDPLWVNCKLESLKSDVGNLRRSLKFALPYCVCVFCGGDVNNEECRACNGNGFLNELQYKAAPKELKGD